MWRKSLCRAERAQAGNGETGVEQGRDSAHRFGRPTAVSPVGSGARPVHVQFLLPGMSFVDVIHLKHDGIVRDTIFYTRSKTGQRLQIGLLPAMKEIIENTGHPARTFFLISTGSHREMPTRNTATLWARSTVTSNAWAHCST